MLDIALAAAPHPQIRSDLGIFIRVRLIQPDGRDVQVGHEEAVSQLPDIDYCDRRAAGYEVRAQCGSGRRNAWMNGGGACNPIDNH